MKQEIVLQNILLSQEIQDLHEINTQSTGIIIITLLAVFYVLNDLVY